MTTELPSAVLPLMSPVSIHPTADVPDFPVETLAGACAYCPVCLAATYPDRTSQIVHYRREHRNVTPTTEQVAAALAESDRFAQEHAADLAAAALRRAAQRAQRRVA